LFVLRKALDPSGQLDPLIGGYYHGERKRVKAFHAE
jgi:hypothetical protein